MIQWMQALLSQYFRNFKNRTLKISSNVNQCHPTTCNEQQQQQTNRVNGWPYACCACAGPCWTWWSLARQRSMDGSWLLAKEVILNEGVKIVFGVLMVNDGINSGGQLRMTVLRPPWLYRTGGVRWLKQFCAVPRGFSSSPRITCTNHRIQVRNLRLEAKLWPI